MRAKEETKTREDEERTVPGGENSEHLGVVEGLWGLWTEVWWRPPR